MLPFLHLPTYLKVIQTLQKQACTPSVNMQPSTKWQTTNSLQWYSYTFSNWLLLWNWKDTQNDHRIQPLNTNKNHINPVCTFTTSTSYMCFKKLPSHLCFKICSGLFPSVFWTRTWCYFIFPSASYMPHTSQIYMKAENIKCSNFSCHDMDVLIVMKNSFKKTTDTNINTLPNTCKARLTEWHYELGKCKCWTAYDSRMTVAMPINLFDKMAILH